MLPRPRSLRFSVFVVMAVVVVAPLVLILLSTLYATMATSNVQQGVADAATETEDALVSTGGERPWREADFLSRIDDVASEHTVRIRIVDPAGVIVAESDYHAGTGLKYLWRKVRALAFGPEGPPSLRDYDDTLGPLADRPESRRALAGGSASGCRLAPGRLLEVCHHVLRLELQPPGDGTLLIYTQASVRRAIRALYDFRFQFAKLTLYNLVIALLLAWWMSRHIVRPVERLRQQVVDRAESALPRAGLSINRQDEIGSLANAFNTLLDALAERARTNEEFLSDLAHEFKNPVAAVRTCAENLGAAGSLEADQAERIARILTDSSNRLDALVSEFLELARAEAGLPGEERESVDLRTLVSNVADGLARQSRLSDGAIQVDAPDEDLMVTGVARRLEMAFRNLIDNGVSFAGESGLVRVAMRRAGDEAEIEIDDSGPGIDEEHLPRVFERFFTTRGKKKGTGLGLALTRAIVEAHGGSIRARNGPDQGAAFIVRLPLA